MAAANGQNEKVGLGHFAKSQTRYGTTTQCNLSPRMDTFVKHNLVKGETLQGIALKYNVSMEQLKRVNKIWTNDSLFLHDYILIPMDCTKPASNATSRLTPSSSSQETAESALGESDEIVTRHELQSMTKSQSLHSSLTDASPKHEPTDLSASEFLSRMDSSLASIKTNIERMEHSTEFPVDASNPLYHLPHHRKSSLASSRHKSRSMDAATIDIHSEPLLAFKSRRFCDQNSYQRLEGSYDGIYEL